MCMFGVCVWYRMTPDSPGAAWVLARGCLRVVIDRSVCSCFQLKAGWGRVCTANQFAAAPTSGWWPGPGVGWLGDCLQEYQLLCIRSCCWLVLAACPVGVSAQHTRCTSGRKGVGGQSAPLPYPGAGHSSCHSHLLYAHNCTVWLLGCPMRPALMVLGSQDGLQGCRLICIVCGTAAVVKHPHLYHGLLSAQLFELPARQVACRTSCLQGAGLGRVLCTAWQVLYLCEKRAPGWVWVWQAGQCRCSGFSVENRFRSCR